MNLITIILGAGCVLMGTLIAIGAKILAKEIQKIQALKTEIEQQKSLLDCQKAQFDNRQKNFEELYNEIEIKTGIKDSLSRQIEEKQNFLDLQLSRLDNQYNLIKSQQDERCAQKVLEAERKIKEIESNCAATIAEKEEQTKQVLSQLAAQLEDERTKYLSIIETVQRLQTEEEKDSDRHIKIPISSREDIDFLLNNVANRLSNPNILYKLIWSEYIQKPTNEMLDRILPQRDCAGIYKITNDKTKKSYIGRSTSVRKRLTDHIKSTVGITTIADQRIHQIMREEGVWNFSFELIEECEKSNLSSREKYYINFFETERLGYNQQAGG